MASENKHIRLSTTTTGIRRDAKPPAGIEVSLLGKLMWLSLHTPFARYGLEISGVLSTTGPFPKDLD